jgi:hypothetical protein
MSTTWTVPAFAAVSVNVAGKTLVATKPDLDALDVALNIISNWRSSHSFPLNTFQNTLRNRAKRVDQKPLVAQRLKRLSAIGAKLRRFPTMRLSAMQDIGGCRAVVADVARVDKLIALYHGGTLMKHQLLREKDYIRQPKPDGYRSVHLIYRYHSDGRDQQPWNGLQIEIQLRSRLQHAWATAVETVDLFTGQALKSSVGSDEWKRFFVLMSGAIVRVTVHRDHLDRCIVITQIGRS